jgi:hypothetical protein
MSRKFIDSQGVVWQFHGNSRWGSNHAGISHMCSQPDWREIIPNVKPAVGQVWRWIGTGTDFELTRYDHYMRGWSNRLGVLLRDREFAAGALVCIDDGSKGQVQIPQPKAPNYEELLKQARKHHGDKEPACDCGGKKCKTTCAPWCSTTGSK